MRKGLAETLWVQLEQLERKRSPYPEGMVPFPRRLMGRGFFPGGDGLWRDEPEDTNRPSLPSGGILYLGNDFGTLETFNSTLKKGYETDHSSPTWPRLIQRIDAASKLEPGIRGQLGFYTNAVLGLRETGKAVDRRCCSNPKWWDESNQDNFAGFCREFLEFQIKTIKPRLIVILGKPPRFALSLPNPLVPELAIWKNKELRDIDSDERIRQGQWQGRKITFLLTSHPYSDISKWKTEESKTEDARLLTAAWSRATN